MKAICALLLFVSFVAACHPECRWACDDPICYAVCLPNCEPPTCSYACPEEGALCRGTQPSCSTRCPDDQCSSEQCPVCETICNPPSTLCVNEGCSIECGPTNCSWSCSKPTTCSLPTCQLSCEAPACETPVPALGCRLEPTLIVALFLFFLLE